MMSSPDLFTVCISAFISVLLLLSLMALAMRLIILFFPEREKGADPTVVAAVASTFSALYPGTKVVKIVEVK